LIRIVANRDVINGQPGEPSQAFPEGILTTISFWAASGYDAVGINTEVGFWSGSCGDNTLHPEEKRFHFYMADSVFAGGDADAMFDTMGCARRYRYEPILSFHSGAVSIQEPEGGFQPGDVNLNGTAFDFGDFVVFNNMFRDGYEPPETRADSLRILATDCNRDGIPLTIADFDFFYRVVFGGAEPSDSIPTPYGETLTLEFEFQGDTLTIVSTATMPVSMLRLQIVAGWDGTVKPDWLGDDVAFFSRSRRGDTLTVSAGWSRGLIRPILGTERTEAIRITNSGVSAIEWIAAEASIAPGSLMQVDVVDAMRRTGTHSEVHITR
jgi:hypothetical protein